jgi:hypothetical protein
MEEKKQDDRWRELAELLGLPTNGAEPLAAKSAPVPPAPPVAAAPTAHAPEVVETRALPTPPPVPPSEASIETIVVDEYEEFVPEEDNGPEDSQLIMEEETDVVAPEPGAPVPEGDEKPRRGRRRRRRGRRRNGDAPDKAAPGEPAGTTEPRPDRPPPREPQRDQRGPRGPRRDRDESAHRAAPAPVPARADTSDHWEREEPPLEEVEPIIAPTAHTDDDEVDNLTDWDVPYWQDLIASLYRPDR